jgi:hypothetical protein
MKRSIGVNDNEKRIFKSTDGKDEHEFELEGPDYKDYKGGEWTYKVWAKGCSDFFEFRVVYFNDKYVRIDMMTNHDRPEYIKKGIAEYLIPTVAKDLNKKILSSRRSNPAEPRTHFAENFWKKMEGKKKAILRHEMEQYEFVSEETLD